MVQQKLPAVQSTFTYTTMVATYQVLQAIVHAPGGSDTLGLGKPLLRLYSPRCRLPQAVGEC